MKRSAVALVSLVVIGLSGCASEDKGTEVVSDLGDAHTVIVTGDYGDLTVVGEFTFSSGGSYNYRITDSYGKLVKGSTLSYEVSGGEDVRDDCDVAFLDGVDIGDVFSLICEG